MQKSYLASRIIGGTLIGVAIGFASFMTDQANKNADHDFIVQFQYGTTPSLGYDDTISDVVTLMNSNQNYHLSVIGHTGTRGPDDTNMELSLQRSTRVIKDLERMGIARNRMEGVGRGETDTLPQGKHETDTLWQKRLDRVELELGVK